MVVVMASATQEFKGKYSREELDSRFATTRWAFYLGMIVVGVVLALATHAALVRANRYLASLDGHAQFVIFPQSAVWWFLPGFAAMTLAFEICLQLWSIFGDRREADLYGYWSGLSVRLRYMSAPADLDVRKILRWMALLIVLPIAILTFLALSVHTTLRQDAIRNCGYAFRPCSTYLYADATRMTIIDGFRTRDGKLTRRAGVVVDFDDGRRWSSADFGDFDTDVDPSLKALLQNRTGLPYNYAQTENDIPPLQKESNRH